jgi:secreted trypsin-like serine protease
VKRPVLLAGLLLAACKPAPDGGGSISPFIVGGTAVPAGKLLGVVGLTYNHAREPLCTGALIAPDMVLTAAHCICSQPPSNIVVGNEPLESGRFYVAGPGKAALRCQDQSSSTGIDLAVVAIAGRVGVTAPLAFASNVEITAARSFQIAGYGATDTAGTQFDYIKRAAVVPVVSASCAGSNEATRFGCQAGEEIVAGRRNTADTCLGDSGAPLLLNTSLTGLDASAWRVAGVTSRGVKATQQCGEGGIYERTATQQAWIDRAVRSLRAEAGLANRDRSADTGTDRP